MESQRIVRIADSGYKRCMYSESELECFQKILACCVIQQEEGTCRDWFEQNKETFRHTANDLMLLGLSGFLHKRLPEPVALLLEDRQREQLLARYKAQLAQTLLVAHQAEGTLKALKESGFDAILVKGISIAGRYYGDAAQRASSDIDLLLRNPVSIGELDQPLMKMGYSRISKRFLHSRINHAFCHAFEYSHATEGLKLDLHWIIKQHPSIRLLNSDCWSTRQSISIAERPFEILSDEYALLMHLLGVFVDLSLGIFCIRDLVDTTMILQELKGKVQWSDFLSNRKADGSYRIVVNMLDLVFDLCGTGDHFSVLSSLVESDRPALLQPSLSEKFSIIERSRPHSFASHHWEFKHYQYPILLSWIWWLTSLPVKFVNHHSISAAASFIRGRK